MIRTEKLHKRFGQRVAVDQLDLEIEPGSVFGFIGPNGAGKTTTLRMLTTLLHPTSGEAWIDGHSIRTEAQAIRQRVGFMPDFFTAYPDMTVREYLHFFAAAHEIPAATHNQVVGGLLELVALDSRQNTVIAQLSRGMKQRLGLARALVHDPSVLILDEPASGLDPRARIEIREVLLELKTMGKTILLSSHILPELQSLCTEVGIMERGRIVAHGALDDILRAHRDTDEVDIRTHDNARAAVLLRELPSVRESTVHADRSGVRVRVERGTDLARLAAHLVERGVGLTHLEQHEPDLEDRFIALTEGLS